MKVNLKCGGVNVHVKPDSQAANLASFMLAKPTTVMGIDVNHAGRGVCVPTPSYTLHPHPPPPMAGTGEDKPSYAAVVGSMDAECATWHTYASEQEARVEKARAPPPHPPPHTPSLPAHPQTPPPPLCRSSRCKRSCASTSSTSLPATARRRTESRSTATASATASSKVRAPRRLRAACSPSRPPPPSLPLPCGYAVSGIGAAEIDMIQRAASTVGTGGYAPEILYIVVQKRTHLRLAQVGLHTRPEPAPSLTLTPPPPYLRLSATPLT